MKKYLAFLILTFCVVASAHGQVDERFDQKKKKDSTKVEQKSGEEIVEAPKAKADKDIWDRLVYGGNATAAFGDVTVLYLAPAVGYKVTDKFIAGTGFIYQYAKLNRVYNYSSRQYERVEGIEDQIYGPKVFVNYLPINPVYLGLQLEVLNHDFPSYDNHGKVFYENLWTPVLFLEAGFGQQLGQKGYAVLGLRLNLFHDIYSPYATALSPVIGFYF